MLEGRDVECRRPGLSVVFRQNRCLPYAIVLGFPRYALRDRPTIHEVHFAFENQRGILEIAGDHHDRAAVSDSGLLPRYARSQGRIERMLSNMFIGRPRGLRPTARLQQSVTGALFFTPSVTFLAAAST